MYFKEWLLSEDGKGSGRRPILDDPLSKYPMEIRQAIIDDANNLYLTPTELAKKYSIRRTSILYILKNKVPPETLEKIKERARDINLTHMARMKEKGLASQAQGTLTRQTPEFREKASRKAKEMWEDPEFREKALAGRDYPEYIEKMRQQAKEMWGQREEGEHGRFWTWIIGFPYDKAKQIIAAMSQHERPSHESSAKTFLKLIATLDSIHPEKQTMTPAI